MKKTLLAGLGAITVAPIVAVVSCASEKAEITLEQIKEDTKNVVDNMQPFFTPQNRSDIEKLRTQILLGISKKDNLDAIYVKVNEIVAVARNAVKDWEKYKDKIISISIKPSEIDHQTKKLLIDRVHKVDNYNDMDKIIVDINSEKNSAKVHFTKKTSGYILMEKNPIWTHYIENKTWISDAEWERALKNTVSSKTSGNYPYSLAWYFKLVNDKNWLAKKNEYRKYSIASDDNHSRKISNDKYFLIIEEFKGGSILKTIDRKGNEPFKYRAIRKVDVANPAWVYISNFYGIKTYATDSKHEIVGVDAGEYIKTKILDPVTSDNIEETLEFSLKEKVAFNDIKITDILFHHSPKIKHVISNFLIKNNVLKFTLTLQPSDSRINWLKPKVVNISINKVV